METPSLQELAAQLRKPVGEMGLETAYWMNQGNGPMNLHTLAVLNPQPADRILEIGMGNGYFVKNIVNIDPTISYTGCDYSADMVRASVANNQHLINSRQVRFVEGNVAALPFEAESFNKIFSVNTLYFWEDVNATLQELKRVMCAEASLILAVRPKHLMEQMPVTQFGFSLFSKEAVISLLTSNGFATKGITEIIEPEQQRGAERHKLETLIIEGIRIQ